MAGSLTRALRLGRRKEAATLPAEPSLVSAPLPRPPTVPHHWLTIAVVRSGPAAPIPVAGARVVVRPFPRGASRPDDPVARGSTGPEGTFAASLPPGRYAVYAQHESDGRAVTITLEHAGRAQLTLESLARRATLSVEVQGLNGLPLADARVDICAHPAGTHVAHALADDDGVATLKLPPGAYEVRVGGALARTYVEADTTLRITAEPQPGASTTPAPIGKYAQRARAATAVVAPLDATNVRDEVWN